MYFINTRMLFALLKCLIHDKWHRTSCVRICIRRAAVQVLVKTFSPFRWKGHTWRSDLVLLRSPFFSHQNTGDWYSVTRTYYIQQRRIRCIILRLSSFFPIIDHIFKTTVHGVSYNLNAIARSSRQRGHIIFATNNICVRV